MMLDTGCSILGTGYTLAGRSQRRSMGDTVFWFLHDRCSMINAQ